MRSSTVDKNGMKQGAWSAEEDRKLIDYITRYRVWNWGYVAKYSGLSRNGKSCRLRWVNYLNPDIKRGNITKEEEQIIVDMYAVMGSRWSAIAKRLPGRTDNEIKNYWYTRLKKKRSNDQNPTQRIEPPHTAETATWEDIGGENSSTRSSSSAASEASNSPADSTNMILTMSATTTSEVSNSPPASINMVLTTSATTSSEASNSPLMIHARGSDNIQVVDNAGTDHHNSFLLQTFGQDFSDIPTDTYNCTGNTYTENDHHLEAYVQERLCSYGPFNDDEYRLNDNSYLPDVVNTCMVGAEMPNCIQHLSYNCTGNTYTESDHQLEAYVQEWPLRSYEPFNSDEYRLNDDNLPDIGDTSMVRSEMPNIQHLSYNCTGNMYADNDHQLEAYVQECACQEEPSCSYDGPFIVDEYQLNHYNYLSDDLVASLVGSSGMTNIQHLPY